jgi:hypothetical protein
MKKLAWMKKPAKVRELRVPPSAVTLPRPQPRD